MDQLINHLRHYYRLSDAANEAIMHCFEEKVFAKNDTLLEAGKICRHLYFIQQGAVRGYYHLDGKEITHWFGFENAFVTSFHSFITGESSVEHIEFIEGSVVFAISKEKLNRLLDDYQEIERLVRKVYEQYYIRLEERYVNAQFKTAANRYKELLEKSPHVLERVPLGYISSFLGITQETLSRIRKPS